MEEKESTGKKIIIEFLDFIKYKVENGTLTVDEVESLSKAVASDMELRGTAEDFAKFYGKSVDNVRHIIHRKVFDKPTRKVLYRFSRFAKEIPQSWKHKE